MASVTGATIQGFNSFLNEQKTVEGQAWVNLVTFDGDVQTVFEGRDIHHVAGLNYSNYVPGGSTAMYDGIGRAIELTERVAERVHPTQVLVVIMTDGYENASRRLTAEDIRSDIQHMEHDHEWNFVYLGANQDAWAVGQMIGVRDGFYANYASTPVGVTNTYQTLTSSTTSFRSSGARGMSAGSFLDPNVSATPPTITPKTVKWHPEPDSTVDDSLDDGHTNDVTS